MKKEEIQRIVNDLKVGKFKQISKGKISELDLFNISIGLKSETNFKVGELIDIILANNINENCDWNKVKEIKNERNRSFSRSI